ncbi:sulfotransferase domain-containing protein [Amycolatopsis acidiphila]|uniref:Sulfotransferase domain-containing protein n=1 Tax=Amycolatopsis acidiphila TaxID=715473 RepID=A0A557ZPV7_9PSEU|nr:sulfotransferase domain-containing protein [Amycolatopsis acidiphila]TVT14053.1 sulfotransferase domain-containing protein [Amycolatopsis acidiphila]UIJ63603.1 sulfotransferase domain-containing protein [Amycolatopsis acidiphila]GHG67988.1 hypothetical protein GCM10017788_27290 [Amycolatopsis acidiphila]
MTEKTYYLLHGLQDRYNALYQDNIERLGRQDVVVASIGSSGQSFLGNILLELGLNYADPYTEALAGAGTSAPVAAYADYRDRLPAHTPPARRWPRFVKSHLPPRFYRARPLLGAWILVRDPRDALYSWYRFRTEFVRDPLDRLADGFEDWLRRPGPTGVDRIDDWVDFYGTWLDDPAVPHAVTSFERLKKEPVGALREGLHAFGLTAGEEQIEQAVRDSSFDAMRRHERDRGGTGAGILRRGTPGEWREWMTPATLAHFHRDNIASLAARFGYDLHPGKETSP